MDAYFTYVTQYGILVCSRCAAAVRPGEVRSHLRATAHELTLAPSKRGRA